MADVCAAVFVMRTSNHRAHSRSAEGRKEGVSSYVDYVQLDKVWPLGALWLVCCTVVAGENSIPWW